MMISISESLGRYIGYKRKIFYFRFKVKKVNLNDNIIFIIYLY